MSSSLVQSQKPTMCSKCNVRVGEIQNPECEHVSCVICLEQKWKSIENQDSGFLGTQVCYSDLQCKGRYNKMIYEQLVKKYLQIKLETCNKCQGTSDKQLISSSRCPDKYCVSCLQSFYKYLANKLQNEPQHCVPDYFVECMAKPITNCQISINLKTYDEMFQKYLPGVQSLINLTHKPLEQQNEQVFQKQQEKGKSYPNFENESNNGKIEQEEQKTNNSLKNLTNQSQQISTPGTDFRQSQYAPKKDSKIDWIMGQFQQYQEVFNKAQLLIKDKKKDLYVKMYEDPYPQNDKLGTPETFEDFANQDCTSTDEKLEIAKTYTTLASRRQIRGDGNCFYRAVICQFLEKIFTCEYSNRSLKLLEEIMDPKFQILDVICDTGINNTYQNQITDLVRLNLIKEITNFIEVRCDIVKRKGFKMEMIQVIENTFLKSDNFDFSAVVLGRTYGMEALKRYGNNEEYLAFCTDIGQLEQILLMYGQDVELTIIPIISETLDITLTVHNFDQVKGSWCFETATYAPKINLTNLYEEGDAEFLHYKIDVMLHQGHYQSVYQEKFTKEIYGKLKNKVAPFNRADYEKKQKEKLRSQAKYEIKVAVKSCLRCNEKKLSASTKQCQHYYCDGCLQEMITFMESRQFTFYNCHYKGMMNNCPKELLMVEFFEMLQSLSDFRNNNKNQQIQQQQQECSRCEQDIQGQKMFKAKCNHQYCNNCVEYIINKMLSEGQNLYQCKYKNIVGQLCNHQLNQQEAMELLTQ